MTDLIILEDISYLLIYYFAYIAQRSRNHYVVCSLSLFSSLSHLSGLQVYKITSSTTEIEEIFHNPAGGLRSAVSFGRAVRPQNILEITIYPVRGTLSCPRFGPKGSERESLPVLLENYSMRERVRRVSCTSIQRTPRPPVHAHVCSCVDTHTHPHPAVTSAHTRPRSLAAGSVGEAEERIPCNPPFVPRYSGTTGRGPMESRVRGGAFGVGQHGSSSSCSPAGGHSAEEDPLRTALVDTPVSTYCSSHVSLSRSLHVSSLASRPPEISRCSDPRNSDRIDTSIALFSVNARPDGSTSPDAGREVKCKRQVKRPPAAVASFLIYSSTLREKYHQVSRTRLKFFTPCHINS